MYVWGECYRHSKPIGFAAVRGPQPVDRLAVSPEAEREGERGREGEREIGREGEREKGRKGERERGRERGRV